MTRKLTVMSLILLMALCLFLAAWRAEPGANPARTAAPRVFFSGRGIALPSPAPRTDVQDGRVRWEPFGERARHTAEPYPYPAITEEAYP